MEIIRNRKVQDTPERPYATLTANMLYGLEVRANHSIADYENGVTPQVGMMPVEGYRKMVAKIQAERDLRKAEENAARAGGGEGMNELLNRLYPEHYEEPEPELVSDYVPGPAASKPAVDLDAWFEQYVKGTDKDGDWQ